MGHVHRKPNHLGSAGTWARGEKTNSYGNQDEKMQLLGLTSEQPCRRRLKKRRGKRRKAVSSEAEEEKRTRKEGRWKEKRRKRRREK